MIKHTKLGIMEKVAETLKYLEKFVKDDEKPLKLTLYSDMSGEIRDTDDKMIFEFARNGDFYEKFYRYIMEA